MRAESRNFGEYLLALFSTLVIGLAAGAVWVVLALYAQSVMAWLALPLGALLGWVTRTWVSRGRGAATTLAVISVGVATFYMRVLFAAAQVGASMGLGFGEALRAAGPGMLINVARLSLHWQEMLFYLAGGVLAATFAARGPRTPPA